MNQSGVRVARNSLWMIAQPIAISVVSVVVTALVARHLGAHDYGLLLLLISYFALFSLVASLGLRQHMVREIASGSAGVLDVVEDNLWLRLVLAGTSAFGLLVADRLFSLAPDAGLLLVGLVAVQVVLHGAAVCFVDALYGLENMRAAASIQAAVGLLVQIMLMVGVWLKADITVFVFIYVLGSGLLFLMALRGFARIAGLPRLHWRRRLRWEQVSRGWQMFLPALFESLRQRVGFFFLGSMLGNQSVGVFGAAQSLVQKLDVIPDGISTASFPRTARLHGSAGNELQILVQGTFKVLLVLATPVACGIPFVAEEIIHLLYGESYMSAVSPLIILGMGMPFLFVQVFLFYVLAGIREHNRLMHASALGTAVGIAAFWIGIKSGGIEGAALAYVVTIAVLACLYLAVCWARLGMPFRPGDLGRIAICNGIMVATLWALGQVPAIVAIIAGAAVYTAAVFGLRLIRWSEIQAVFRPHAQ